MNLIKIYAIKMLPINKNLESNNAKKVFRNETEYTHNLQLI
jgi:hypothetical protein